MPLLSRRLRRRLSPAARPMAVRARLPWYVQGAVAFCGLALSFAAGFWLYDRLVRAETGVGGAGADRVALAERVEALEREQTRLRALVDSGESRLQVERTAQEQLARQVKVLEEENGRLKEELSFFDSVLSTGPDARPAIHRFRVEASGVPGEYRYRLLVTSGAAREAKEFSGSLQLVVSVRRSDGEAVVTFPQGKGQDDAYRLSFKRVQRVEGLFRIEPSATVKAVQVRVMEHGASSPRASESFTMS